MESEQKRIVITGPTASGKTELAHHLARELGGEIISVDSRQCYRRIDIGTAKPGPGLLGELPYHNISILDLEEADSAAAFAERAGRWTKEIEKRENRVIYAGGSTLHLQSLIQPFDNLPASNSRHIKQLEERIEQEGLEVLFDELQRVDPEYAADMDGMNRQRIIRALDVWMQTGKPFSSFHTRPDEAELPGNMVVFGLRWPRKLLYDRINSRADRMLERGLVKETEQILDDGYSPDLQALQTVGYRQAIDFLNGNLSGEQMARDIKTQTRRYAKRQITWFRRWPFIQWLDAENSSVDELAGKVIQTLQVSS